VTAHGGQLELVPQARGTCFRIRLPVEAPVITPRSAGHQIGVAPGA
jgi:hypothetical protein